MIKAIHTATGRTTVFTELIWKGMGKNKNGWEIDNSEDVDNAAAELDLQDNGDYLARTKEGKALLEKGNLAGALAAYQAAQAVKDNSYVKGQIYKISALINAELAPAPAAPVAPAPAVVEPTPFDVLVAEGDAAINDQDFETAIEKYGAALDIQEDEEVDSKFQAAQASLELN